MKIVLHGRTRRTLHAEKKRARALGDLPAYDRFNTLLLLEYVDLKEVAPVLGVHERSVFAWVALLNQKGPEGLRTRRRTGRPPKLTVNDKMRLKDWVRLAPKAFGFEGEYWTCVILQALLQQHTSATYSTGYIAALLRSFGCSWFKQEVVPNQADPETQRIWRKQTWPELLAKAAREGAVVVYQDEVSFERTPGGTYGWGDRQRIQKRRVHASGGSCKLMGTMELGTGQLVWHVFPKKKKGERYSHRDFVAFLRQVAQAYRGQKVYLICDNGPLHHGPAPTKWLESHADQLHLEFLPPYSPKFNPIERLWKKAKRLFFHGHDFKTLTALEQQVRKAMRHFQRHSALVQSLMQAEIRVWKQFEKRVAA